MNVRAPFFLVQQLLPVLGKGSSVVLLSSLAAHASVGTLSAYAATKGAIDTLVKHFAAALGARGIRVNAVAPGVVDTDMSSFARTDAGRDFTLGMQALKRVAQPDDIARCDRFPRLRRRPLDHRRHAAGRRRLEALTISGGTRMMATTKVAVSPRVRPGEPAAGAPIVLGRCASLCVTAGVVANTLWTSAAPAMAYRLYAQDGNTPGLRRRDGRGAQCRAAPEGPRDRRGA